MNSSTGQRHILTKLHGSPYEAKHVRTHTITKRHTAHLLPFPLEIVPFQPVDGPNNRFGQIYIPIQKSPYSEAGIKGFHPTEPYKPAQFSVMATLPADKAVEFPTLAELLEECFDWNEGEESAVLADDSLCKQCYECR